MNNAEKHYQKRALDEVMNQIFSTDSPYAFSIIAAVRRYIQQFNLDSYIEPADILIEAYLRGLNTINRGDQITNCSAWIKGAARRIVLERARQRIKERPTDPQAVILDPLPEFEDCCKDVYESNLAILRQAFNQLRETDPDIAELMDWRVLEGLSWSEIRQRLLKRDGASPSEEVLRQRATRTKRKLRRLFNDLGGKYQPVQQ